MRANCMFHGIGQGLFYHCVIQEGQSTFSFVYDCGTYYKKDQDRLSREITHLFSHAKGEKASIQALFLSHFDRDHISGIPQLLQTYHVENVFIPYFTPEVLLLLAAKNELFEDAPELLDMYTNPADYFHERGCQNVFLLHPDDEPYPREPGEDRQQVSETGTFWLEGNIQRRESTANTLNSLYFCHGPIHLRPFRCNWEFHIYQDQTQFTQKALQAQIQRLLPMNGTWAERISRLLADPGLLAQAKEIYKTVQYGINQSSLVLYHAPEDRSGIVFELQWPIWCCCSCCISADETGTLLTGDLNLAQLRDRGHSFTQFVLKPHSGVRVFQLPHHGSGKSISVNQIAKILRTGRTLLVCSYGQSNQFKHPDPYTLDQLRSQCHSPIIHVVADESFSYLITVNN